MASIYHGVFQTMAGSVYRLGVALHDLRNPAKIIGVGDSWILQPEDPWEITGICPQRRLHLWRRPGVPTEPSKFIGAARTRSCVWAKRISPIWSRYAWITPDRPNEPRGAGTRA